MALYFFDLCNGSGFLPDEEGRQFKDADAALEMAREEVRALAAAEIAEGRPLLLGSYLVVRRDAEEIGRVYFREVIEVRDGH